MQGKNNNPLVSICLPTYNYAHYLPEAISSCLSQTYDAIEIIIVDDASTDDSRPVIQSFADPRIRFSENPVRLGLAGNWNKTLSLVRGEIVKFIFADDYLREDAIAEIVKAYDNPSVDLVFSSARAIDGRGDYMYTHEPYPQSILLPGRDEARRCLKDGNYIGGPSSVAVRTSAFKRVGTFDETLRFHVDQEMWIRILLQGDGYFLSPPLVSVRQHEGSETSRLERAGETDADNLRFLTGCLLNDRIRSLLSPDDLKQLTERRDDLSRLQSERAMSGSQSGQKTGNPAAVLTSKIPPSLGTVLQPVSKRSSKTKGFANRLRGLCQDMKLLNRIRREAKPAAAPDPRVNGRMSYSQCGEDLIIEHILALYLKIEKPSYLDIGAHHPTYLSNTYFFYMKGSQGVCVEPDPDLFAELKRIRPRDTCLNVGVGTAPKDKAEFFRMSTPTLNTFSRVAAERYESYGNQKIAEVVELPLLPINTILTDYFDACPNLVSLDIEGYDLEILGTFDFSIFRPEVFCLETLTYTEDNSAEKIMPIIELMTANGYFTYADTYINTIFIDERSWKTR